MSHNLNLPSICIDLVSIVAAMVRGNIDLFSAQKEIIFYVA